MNVCKVIVGEGIICYCKVQPMVLVVRTMSWIRSKAEILTPPSQALWREAGKQRVAVAEWQDSGTVVTCWLFWCVLEGELRQTVVLAGIRDNCCCFLMLCNEAWALNCCVRRVESFVAALGSVKVVMDAKEDSVNKHRWWIKVSLFHIDIIKQALPTQSIGISDKI